MLHKLFLSNLLLKILFFKNKAFCRSAADPEAARTRGTGDGGQVAWGLCGSALPVLHLPLLVLFFPFFGLMIKDGDIIFDRKNQVHVLPLSLIKNCLGFLFITFQMQNHLLHVSSFSKSICGYLGRLGPTLGRRSVLLWFW